MEHRIKLTNRLLTSIQRCLASSNIEHQKIAWLTVRHAVLKEAWLVVQVGKSVAHHRVDAPSSSRGWGIADLRIHGQVMKVPLQKQRMDVRLLAKGIERVLVRGVQEWLADVEQKKLDVRLGQLAEELLNEADFQISVAGAQRDDLQKSLSTVRADAFRKLC